MTNTLPTAIELFFILSRRTNVLPNVHITTTTLTTITHRHHVETLGLLNHNPNWTLQANHQNNNSFHQRDHPSRWSTVRVHEMSPTELSFMNLVFRWSGLATLSSGRPILNVRTPLFRSNVLSCGNTHSPK